MTIDTSIDRERKVHRVLWRGSDLIGATPAQLFAAPILLLAAKASELDDGRASHGASRPTSLGVPTASRSPCD